MDRTHLHHSRLGEFGVPLEIVYGLPYDGDSGRIWKRCGEWILVPAPRLDRCAGLVYHRDEPLVREGALPCVAEMLHREVRGGHGAARIYVRGRIEHPDRAALRLESWYRVLADL